MIKFHDDDCHFCEGDHIWLGPWHLSGNNVVWIRNFKCGDSIGTRMKLVGDLIKEGSL